MDNPRAIDEQKPSFQQWCFHETVENLHKEQTLTEERRELEAAKREFLREQEEFQWKKEFQEKLYEQQNQLFEMKFKMLEEELVKLANEKKRFQMQKTFYDKVNAFSEENETRKDDFRVVKGEMFFTGVENRQSLKKRYKDLIKIYHPDNLAGDTDTLQEINREFDKLNKIM